MKYVNCLIPVALVAALALTGCSTGGSKLSLVTDADVRPELLSTRQYLPEQLADDEGQWLPYEAGENPYTNQRGRVRRDSVVSFIEARRAFKAQKYDEAEALLQELTEQDQRLSGPWVMLGDIAVERDQYQQALDYYVRAIDINSNNVNAYLRLAKVQRIQGQFLHAQNTYTKALSIWPDFPEAHLNLAVLYDVYLNHPLRAQRHMEAYQFLTHAENDQVATWLAEIRRRTGLAPAYHFEQAQSSTESQPVSYSN